MSALFVRLEVDWVDNPKLIAGGMAVRGCHAVACCLAKRLETDGWVDRALLAREGADDALVDRLVELELFEVDGRRVRPWNWHDRNPSQGAIDATRTAKAEAAKAGNHKRWKHDGPVADCAVCSPASQVDRICDPAGSQGVAGVSPESDPETEPDTSQPAGTTPTATVLAKHACLVIARQQIADRVASGAIGNPAAVAKQRAEVDLWPILGAVLVSLAEQNPSATADQVAALAEVDPLTGYAPTAARPASPGESRPALSADVVEGIRQQAAEVASPDVVADILAERRAARAAS